MKPIQYALIGLLVAGAGGFFAGRISVASSDSVGGVDDSSNPSSLTGRSGYRGQEGGPAGSTARQGRSSLAEKVGRGSGRSSSAPKLDQLIRNEDALTRYRGMLSFIDGIMSEDFESTVSEFREMGMTQQRFGEYAMLLSAWAKVDPIGALEYAGENTGTSFATDTILSAWATNDPEAAIRWANENHSGEDANPYMVGIIRAMGQGDPTRASQLLFDMPKSVERGKALDGLIPALLTQGDDATRQWIETVEDDSLRNGAILRTAERFAETDPAGTFAWLQANPGEAANRRVDDVFRTWAKNNELEAMSAYKALPEGEERSNALRGIVSNLAAADPEAAVELMDSNATDVNERMIRSFAWQTFDDNPQIAVDQIARLENDQTKDWMYRRFVGSWMREDSAAANAWLQQNSGIHPSVDRLIQRNMNNPNRQ